MREKSYNSFDSRPSTTRSFSNNSTIKMNGYDVTPTPPVNGHATFIRRNGRRSLHESLPQRNRSSPILSIEQFSRTTNYPNSSSIASNRPDDMIMMKMMMKILIDNVIDHHHQQQILHLLHHLLNLEKVQQHQIVHL